MGPTCISIVLQLYNYPHMNIKLSNIFKLYGWRFNQFLFVFVSCDLILEISVWPSFVFSFRYGPISIYDFREPQSEDYNL